jgi:hypothetical protein
MPTLPYLTDTSTQLSGTYTTSTEALDNYATSNYISSNYLPLKGAVLNDRINLIIPTAATCKLALTGQPFQASGTYSTEGVALILAASDNLWIGRTSQLQVNTTNRVVRISPIGNIDCLTTNGGYGNPLTLQGVIVAYSQGVGIGTTSIGSYKCNINGSLNSTSLYQNGTLIDFSSYATNANLTTNYYNKTSTDTLLNAKQPNLTVSTTLLGTGGSITGINYNTVINKPLYSLPLSSNANTNTISVDLNAYATNVSLSLAQINNSNYTRDASNVLQTNINTTNTNLTTTNTNLTNNYYTKTSTDTLLNAKEQVLTFSSPLTRSTNTIGINLSSYSTTGNDTNYVLKSGSTMTGNLTTGTLLAIGGGLGAATLHITDIPQAGWKLQTGGYNLTFTNDSPTAGTFATKMTLTNAGNLTTIGTITGTTFSGSGASLTNVPYAALTGTVPFYTKSEADTLLNAKEQILTFSSPLTRSTNTIGINLSSYSTTGNDTNYVLKSGSTMTGLLTGTTINATTALQEAGTNLVSKYLTLSGGTLTGDLTGTNIRGTKVSAADATGVNAACLGRLLNVVGTNAVMRIWRDSGTNAPTMEFMSGPMTSGTSYTKLWDMGCGGTTDTNYFYIRDRKPPSTAEFRLFINDAGNIGMGTTSPVSKLDVRGTIYSQTSVIADITNIGATNNYQLRLSPPSTATQYAIIQSIYQSASLVYTPLILQASGGNVGIGNPSPMASLSIGSPNVVNSDGTITLSKNSGGGAIRNFKIGLDASFNFCIGDFGNATSGNTWASTQLTINYSNGNVGIGAVNQTQKLYVNGNIKCTGNITVDSGTSVFNNSVYITNPDGRQTHFPFLGNNQNYLRGKVNIDQDDLFVGGAVQFNSTLSIANSLSVGTTASIGGLLRHRQSFNYGETVSYEIGYNGSPGLDGWWWTTNGFWAGYGTASYLTIAVTATGVSAVWFGRAYLAGTGGAYAVVQDFRQPDNNNLNQITVTNQWGANGANAMRITILNGAYGGTFIIKVSG